MSGRFDVDAARRAGFSDAEIVQHLAGQRGFNADAARQAGYTDAEILAHLAPQRGAVESAARDAAQYGAGFNERAAQVVGAPFDLVNRGLRAVGVPIPETPGGVAGAAQRGLNAVLGAPPDPENDRQRLIRAAGRGTADAATVLIPAATVARTAQAGGIAANAGAALAAQPAAQVAAGVAGSTVEEATDSPLAGLAAAVATPFALNAAGRAVTPAGVIAPERRALAAAAAREGIPVSPGQLGGNRGLQNVEAAFATLPSTAGAQARLRDTQAERFNRAVLRRADTDAPRATPEILAAAEQRIGQTIGDISARTTPDFAQVAPAIQSLRGEVSRYAPDDVQRTVLNRLEDVEKLAARLATIPNPGRAARELDSNIGRDIRSAQGDRRRYLREVQSVLRDAVRAGATTEDALALDQARRAYANLVRIETAQAGAGAEVALGNISPNRLRDAVTTGDQRGYAVGRGDLNELSRIGQAFVREPLPNSATAERTLMQNVMTGGAFTGGASVLGADPMAAAGVAATTLALPRAVQALYNSRLGQLYLKNQLLPEQRVAFDRALAIALAGQQAGPAALPAAP